MELINNNGCQATVSDNREEKGYKTLNGLLFAIATHKKEYDHTLFCMDAKDSFRITTIE